MYLRLFKTPRKSEIVIHGFGRIPDSSSGTGSRWTFVLLSEKSLQVLQKLMCTTTEDKSYAAI